MKSLNQSVAIIKREKKPLHVKIANDPNKKSMTLHGGVMLERLQAKKIIWEALLLSSGRWVERVLVWLVNSPVHSD